MFRAMSWTLHQRRYRALAIAMGFLLIGCVGAGTFELHRYHEKVQANDALQRNVRSATVPLTPQLVALTGDGPGAGNAVKYRSVRVTGRYDTGAQTYLGNETQHGREGFFVLTPLRTSAGVLLVARGFVATAADGGRPARIPDPPSGTVSVVGRLYPAQTGSDQLGELGRGEITAVNADEQASRLGTPVYQAWISLDGGRPGTSGLRVLPDPPRSDPSGGASEWQLLSYVVQWYVFALLALLAPFFFARTDTRDAQRRYLGIDPDEVQFDRPQLAAAAAVTPESGALVRRATGDLARASAVSARVAQARRLADRYGRSLGPDPAQVVDAAPVLPRTEAVPRSSRNAPHRGADAHHADYNDYLWQLALADGEAPDVDVSAADAPRRSSITEYGPRVIDADNAPDTDR